MEQQIPHKQYLVKRGRIPTDPTAEIPLLSKVPFRVMFAVVCSQCGAREEQPHEVPANTVVPKVAKPAGWQQLNNRLVCPKHRITIHD